MAPIILYGLQPRAGGNEPNFSPFVWLTKIELRYLELEYEERNLSFCQIRGELADKVGNKDITVPVIVDGETTIHDSFKIAEYLEEKYAKPAGKSLFLGTAEGKVLARMAHISNFYAQWEAIRPLLFPSLIERLDSPSREYFIADRFEGNTTEYESWLSSRSDPTWVDAQARKVAETLRPLNRMLHLNEEAGYAPAGELWIGGRGFSHADAVIFGLYAWHALNRDMKEKAWENEKHVYLRRWLEQMKRRFIRDPAELYNNA